MDVRYSARFSSQSLVEITNYETRRNGVSVPRWRFRGTRSMVRPVLQRGGSAVQIGGAPSERRSAPWAQDLRRLRRRVARDARSNRRVRREDEQYDEVCCLVDVDRSDVV